MRTTTTVPTPFDCVIFDCDGVLVDSEALSAEVMRSMSLEAGVRLTPAESFGAIHGRKVAEWVSELEVRSGRPLTDDFVPRFRRRCEEVFERELLAVADVEQAIRQLRVPFCTASSAPRAKITKSLTLTGLLSYFEDRIISAYEVGSWKPDPGVFLAAADRMGVPPNRCAVVEDSLVGVQAGVAAGMVVYGYAPAGTRQMLADAGARTFGAMSELPGLVSC